MVESTPSSAVERIIEKIMPTLRLPAAIVAPIVVLIRSQFANPPPTLRARLEDAATAHNGELSTGIVWDAVLLALGDD